MNQTPGVSRTKTLVTISILAIILALQSLAQTTNQVLSLDGSGDYVSIPNAADLQNPTEITVEAWIYPQNTDQCQFIVKGDNASGDSQRSYDMTWGNIIGGKPGVAFEMFLGATTYATVGVPLPVTNWTHVAVTYASAAGLLQLYTNGVLAVTTNRTTGGAQSLAGLTVRQTTFPLNIGGQPMIPGVQYSGGFAAGSLDEVRIWSRARSAEEIQASKSCRLSGSEPGLAGYWNFDAGAATDVT
ncbi:MAG TPA: LamG domain-containing protein, partial [Verrucomicrobiae bacterium]